MGKHEIVQKLWNLCNVLRDDGITYHQYVTELTYILFLKMYAEKDEEKEIVKSIAGFEELKAKDKAKTLTEEEGFTLAEKEKIARYSWEKLASLQGLELKTYYNDILRLLGFHCRGRIQDIFKNATSNIDEPKNLEKIVKAINGLDWYNIEEDGFGDLYEGLLEKNANEKKSGAGQYFTPRVLIDVMVKLSEPQIGEYCNDPACGTFGFMIAANQYLKDKYNDYASLNDKEYDFQINKAFTGCELVPDTHRLALMNALIHGLHGKITQGDTLFTIGKDMKNYDLVLTNPPFGTKQGGERASRDDLTYLTSNKQLNFLQHIYRSLNVNGKARAAVVLPDNVLFADNDGTKIRQDLMNKCNLHTVLRLPTGIFYAQGVKTNVLFFTRGVKDTDNTKEVYFYDMRTNMPSFGKTTPLKQEHFDGFIKAYTAEDRNKIEDERWTRFTRQEIADKKDSLDLGLIKDDSIVDYEDLLDPIESAEDVLAQLEQALDLIQGVAKELKSLKQDSSKEVH